MYQIQEELVAALRLAGPGEQPTLPAMHFSEIASECERVLETLIAVRAHAHREDTEATQEALAELAIALEHLPGHVQEVLPELERALDIQP